jgi:hypothetical protein
LLGRFEVKSKKIEREKTANASKIFLKIRKPRRYTYIQRFRHCPVFGPGYLSF